MGLILRIIFVLFILLLQGSCANQNEDYPWDASEFQSEAHLDPKSYYNEPVPIPTGRRFTDLHPLQIPQPPKGPSNLGIQTSQVTTLSPEVQQVIRSYVPDVPFKIEDHSIYIDGDNHSITYTATVVTKGNKKELVQLKGTFDPREEILHSILYATDAKVLSERRMQAVVECDQVTSTDDIGKGSKQCLGMELDFYYRVDGQTHRLRVNTSGLNLQRAGSGDAVDADEGPIVDDDSTTTEPPAPPTSTDQGSASKKPQKGTPHSRQNYRAKEQTLAFEFNPPRPIEFVPDPNTIIDPIKPPQVSARPFVANGPDDVGASSETLVQAVNYHNNGRLENPREIISSAGLTLRTLSRNRNWGTNRMHTFIEDLAQRLIKGSLNFSVGDIAQRRGGKIGHSSHQTGLDVDIDFAKTSNNRFDVPKNWILMKAIVADHEDWISAAFISSALKRSLCLHAQKNEPEALTNKQHIGYKALHYMVPEEEHTSHTHVRLLCPSNMSTTQRVKKCLNTVVIIREGTGCS
ncbi:MAG: penicillin-insensitive murein endopeptidase [Bdellovibrionales bacterium]|nr:penicillin-insensitive murein endopeptidase [Bdellovibrionales bacterium]